MPNYRIHLISSCGCASNILQLVLADIKILFFMSITTAIGDKGILTTEFEQYEGHSSLDRGDSVELEESSTLPEILLQEDNSEENSSEYSDVNYNEIIERIEYSKSLKSEPLDAVNSKSSENLRDYKGGWHPMTSCDNDLKCLKAYNNIVTTREYFVDINSYHIRRNWSSEQDIRYLKFDILPIPETDSIHVKSKKSYRIEETPSESEFKIKNRKFRILWEIENKQKQLRRLVTLSSQESNRDSEYLGIEERRKSAIDCQKKRVRFSTSKMDGDLNFRATLSIKNEADGQTVFYKVDKNRFRKEKTIKLMVETMYRVDISFKPTQTLARALIKGHEVKTIERVHDSTASAYSLHLPTRNLQPSPKGHRDEITFLIQFTNGMVLQTFLQVKFYKAGDTQHGEWGSTFHCVEYDCESYPETGVISVLKETFR